MSIVEQLEAAGETFSPAVRAALVALDSRATALEEENRVLKAHIRDLENRLAMNSTNSSKPPSSDPPGLPRRKRQLSGRKRGGQKGHAGSWRSLLPAERVDQVVHHRPAECRHCGHSLQEAKAAGRPRIHQQIELSKIRAKVTEHRALKLSCPRCGKHTRAALPAEIATSSFGPQLVAMGAMLTSRFRLSRRDLKDFFTDLLDVPAPSLGTTQAFAREAARALLPAYREVRRTVRRSERAGVDETGWKLRGKTRWVWTAVSPKATLFHLGRSRSKRDLHRLVGSGYSGVVTSDRWRTYKACARRQLCWAHLQRNLEGLGLRGEAGADSSRQGLAECERLFELWHGVRHGDIDRPELRRRIRPLRARFGRLLRAGAESDDRKVAAFCRDLLGQWTALWTFACVEGVEPTNNAAERALRRAVLWRKCCFGSQSGTGLRFAERMLTLSETCRQSGQNILNYLTRAIVASRQNAPAPRLLPSG